MGRAIRGGSLFHRLFKIFFVAAMVMALIGFLAFKFGGEKKATGYFRANVDNYADYMASQIGRGEDPKIISQIRKKYGFHVRVETPSGEYLSGWDEFSVAEIRTEGDASDHFSGNLYRLRRTHSYIFEASNGLIYVFVLPKKFGDLRYPFLIFVLVVGAGIVFFILHRRTKKLLDPVQELTDQMKAFGGGNLESRVQYSASDEFGQLARSFNHMADQVKGSMELRDQLLSDVSHELRTPVTRAKVAIEMIEKNDIQRGIKEDLDEMEEMIKIILESARIDSPEFSKDLSLQFFKPILASVVDEFFKDQRDRIKIEKVDERAQVYCDEAWSKVLLKNIIDNALKYSPQDAIVEVFSQQKIAGELFIVIEDRGCGIADEDLEKVFEPFYRVDKSRSKGTGGLGLGLHLVKKISQAFDGEVSIQSELGIGSKVILKLRS